MIRAAPAPMLPGETLGEFRRLPESERWRRKSEAWAGGLVDAMPMQWARDLLARWRDAGSAEAPAASLCLLRQCDKVMTAQGLGVRADAGDDEVCQVAMQAAAEALRRVQAAGAAAVTAPAFFGDRVRSMPPVAADVVVGTAALWCLADWFESMKAGDLWRAAEDRAKALRPLLARATCDRWWRRILRRVLAVAVESTARAIGKVHKRAGCYASDEAVKRRTAQIERNARTLESVTAINDAGQSATLAELAAKGPANREIRRHELMTRIAGYELIAKDCGHVAYFVTVTCPSRMHAWRSKPGSKWQTEANPKHDGTRPDEAQRYLTKQWARFRAAADRAGLGVYGFRIAEPNHDGTPHWHCLLFFPAVAGRAEGAGAVESGGRRRGAGVGGGAAVSGVDDSLAGRPDGSGGRLAYRVAVRLLRRYFLHQDTPDERGARKHRVKVERIDWDRGSAAGYVAKYVAKNIDGYKVEKDLYGNDCLTASQRVDAWASTWRIRQFQQLGGAPVTIWRELRRVHPEQAAAGPGVALALDAVNLANAAPEAETEAVQRYTAAHAWQTYLRQQGGHRVRRADLRIRMLRESTGEIGRYGEPMAPRPVGVVMQSKELEHRPEMGIVQAMTVQRLFTREVESERAQWIIVAGIPKPPGNGVSQAGHTAGPGVGPMGNRQPADAGPLGFPAREARPWSPVINCTRHDDPGRLFAPAVQRHSRLRKWADWSQYRVKEHAERGLGDQPKELEHADRRHGRKAPHQGPPTRGSSQAPGPSTE